MTPHSPNEAAGAAVLLARRAQAVIRHVIASEAAQEGPRAFAEHREPRWTGR